jgi:hypothetical protein
MTRVQLQFHAVADELLALADEWMSSHGLHGVVQRFWPDFLVRPVAAGEAVAAAASALGDVRRICLRPSPLDISADAPHTFLASNPDCLVIDLGQRSEEGLRESTLAGSAEDADVLKLWQKLVRETRKRTHAGATLVNPQDGARRPLPKSRHTEGAHELAASGVPMLALAGWVRYEFDDLAG